MSPGRDTARRRYVVMNALRIGALAAVLLGLAMTRQVVAGPWWLGAALAVAGLLGFYFLPGMLVRRWKRGDGHG